MINSNANAMSHIEAMRAQEERVGCCDYFQTNASTDVDESCRKSMVAWCHQVQKALNFSPDTAWIATSFLDRYLSSGRGKSRVALGDRYQFQLAAITAFYTAVKIYEPVELSAATLAKLCQDYYVASDILSTEEDILFALDWRVSCPTPMDFVRYLLEFLPQRMSSSISDNLLQVTKEHIERATADFYFALCKPSVIGASCLATSLTETNALSSAERQAFWLQLARITDLIEVMEAQNELLKGRTPRKSIAAPKATAKKTSAASKAAAFQRRAAIASGNTSLVRVTRTARQA